MKRSIKIMLGVVLGLVVILALFLVRGDFVQGLMRPAYDVSKCYDSDGGQKYDAKGTTYGKISTRDSKTQYTDYCDGDMLTEYRCEGTQVKQENIECYDCNNAECTIKKKTENAIDTLVIVNTDIFSDISKEYIEDVFKLSEELWLFPKTGMKFNILKIEFVSYEQFGVEKSTEYLDEYYFSNEENRKNLPEYIALFTEAGVSAQAGGGAYKYKISWPIDDSNYCTEFPVPNTEDKKIPMSVIDYEHKYGRCGYDKLGDTIISDKSANGECSNTPNLTCIWENGYQMCPNLANDFFAQSPLNFPADVAIHEFLHSYGPSDMAYSHFTIFCLFDTGWISEKNEMSFFEYVDNATVTQPFDNIQQEYTTMCPNVWQNFINSQQDCPQ